VVTSTTHKTLRGPRSGFLLSNDKEVAKRLDRMVFPGLQGGPLEHVIAGKAVAFWEAMQPEFREYAARIIENAQALAEALAARGYRVVSGGTDNHLFLLDLRPQQMTGKRAVELLDPAGITVSKSMIPYDPEKPAITSGIRIGTPAITTRGFMPQEMPLIAELIDQALRGEPTEMIKDRVRRLALAHPLP
jgi:glycine hydroxymethyltransferase